MTTDASITAEHLRETARVICKGLPEDELHCHPAWRAADRIDQLESNIADWKDRDTETGEAFLKLTDDHDYWKRRAGEHEARAKELERQMLAGLQALGIGCKSIDQCAAFEREVRGTINVLEEQRTEAEKHRDQAIRKMIAWCEDPAHRRNRTLQQQCAMLDELRRQLIDDLEEATE